MNIKSIFKITIIGATFAAGVISSDQIEEQYSQLKSRNLITEAKIILRPAFVYAGLKEPLKVNDKFQQPIFIDTERVFTKTVKENGNIIMSEHPQGSFADIFNSNTLIFESESNAIYERFSSNGIERRITFTKNDKDFPLNIVRLLASVVKHGSIDDSNDYRTSLESLKTRQLSMTCGVITLLTKDILREAGAQSRVITTLNLGEWNTYSNGHTFLEIWIERKKQWAAVDLDTKSIFMTPDEQNASALDIANYGIDAIRLKKLTSTPVIDYSGFAKYQTTAEYMVYDLRSWYSKMVQAVGIYDETSQNYIFLARDNETAKRVEAYSPNYKASDPESFTGLFYR